MLQVERLSIHFADREEVQEVVRGISFSVQDGEIVGIVGESGSGKTMTALTIAGLFKEHAVLDAGTIRNRSFKTDRAGNAAGAGEPDRHDFSGADDRLESDDEDRKTGGGGAASAYGSG